MQPCKVEDSVKDQARTTLSTILHKHSVWIKVHAAEYLLWLNQDISEVQKAYLEEYEQFQNEPKYRIGISRVLYQTETDTAKKQVWLDKVLAVFGDTTSPDRIHAAETLAKLKTSPETRCPEATLASLNDTSRILQTYTLWATSYTSPEAAATNKLEFIRRAFEDPDTIIRKISAYILMKSRDLTGEEWDLFASRALKEPRDNDWRNNLLQTALVTYTGGDDARFRQIKSEICEGWSGFSASQRIELAQALAEKGDCSDVKILSAFLNDQETNGHYDPETPVAADLRAASAFALLKIAERN